MKFFIIGWREIDGYKARDEGKLCLLDDLFSSIKSSRPADASEIKDARTPGSSPLHPRKSTMRKSLKNLFSSAPKFQRSLKRYGSDRKPTFVESFFGSISESFFYS